MVLGFKIALIKIAMALGSYVLNSARKILLYDKWTLKKRKTSISLPQTVKKTIRGFFENPVLRVILSSKALF